MGLFGTLKKLSDSVNKVADDFGKSTVEDYGPPVYTLYTALQLGNLNRRIDVTDEQDNGKKAGQPSREALYHDGRRQKFYLIQ